MPPSRGRPPTRRRVLRLAATAGVGGLAGCQSPLSEPADDATPTDADPSTPPPTGTASGTATPVDTVTFDGGGAAAFADALSTVEANPGSTLAIAPGTYHLDGFGVGRDYDGGHFLARGLADVTIDGTDAEFVFTDARLGGLHFVDCESTTLRGLTVDYETPPYARATITAVDEAAGAVEIAVDDGYPGFEEGVFASVDPAWATVHDPATGDFYDSPCCGGSVLRFDGPESLGSGRYRLRNVRPWRGLAAGRTLVVVARVPRGSALRFVGCAEPLVEDVTVHTAPLFVALVALCESPTFRNVTARPRPGSGRPVAATADGFHAVNCDPGPTFEGCRLERLEDDAFAVTTKMHRVDGLVDDRTARVEVVGSTLVRPGDTIEVLDGSLDRRGTLPAVESVATAGPPDWPADLKTPREVTFAETVADRLSTGHFLYNRSRANAGFAIRDCVVREIRARHVRITARNGVVEGCELDGSTSPAILLQPTTGHGFPPNAPTEDVTIRNNTIVRAARNGPTTPWPGAVVVWADVDPGADDRRPAGQPNENVVVAGNVIRDVAHKGVHVADTAGVEVRDNVVEQPNWLGLDGNEYGVGFDNVRDVSVTGNRVVGSGEALAAFGVRSRTSGLTALDNELVVDGDEEPARVVERDSSPW